MGIEKRGEGNGAPEKEQAPREIKYNYREFSIDLYEDLINHVALLEDEFPECAPEIVEGEDDIVEENMTITIRLRADSKDFETIKKALDENFAPSVFEKQRTRIDGLLKKHK